MQPPRILILDAEPVVRSVVSAILQRGGYTVEQASTVPAALEVVKEKPTDLLLTNVYLPGITGREAVQMFRNAWPKMPVLIVSGLPDSDVIQEWAGTVGFDTFPKPFAAQDLLDKVHSILDAHDGS
jgi:two-component system, NtrC family, response regulator AtoC